MKVKNGEIFKARGAIHGLEEASGKIPIKYGFPIIEMAEKLYKSIGTIETAYNKLIKKYGREWKGKISVEPKDKAFTEFAKEVNELMEIKVDVDIKQVEVPDTLGLTLKDLATLRPFIKPIEIGGK